LLIQKMQKQQKKKLQQHFLDLAQQQQLKISQYDFWNHNFAIGFDRAQNKLFYFRRQSEVEQTASISLSEVTACRVANINRDVNGSKVFDLIELRFKFQNPKLPEQALLFYSKEETITLNEELILAEKWNTIVGMHLPNQQSQINNISLKGGSLALA
ncbi:hypothetical protein CLV24_1642, partial [Pontibacter ummariensis]